MKLLSYLAKRIGETLNAVITGVEDFGLFAQGVELPAEGLIHVDTLDDDFYRYDSATHSLAGYRSGNRYLRASREKCPWHDTKSIDQPTGLELKLSLVPANGLVPANVAAACGDGANHRNRQREQLDLEGLHVALLASTNCQRL